MVRFKIYMTYLRANGGFLFWLFAFMLFISARSAQVLGSWWLKEWTNANTEKPHHNYNDIFSTLTFYTKSQKLIDDNLLKFIKGHDVSYYFNIYALITSISIFLGVTRFIWLYYGSLRASKILYQLLLHRVIRAPLRFFDTTPVGRILNRFSKDFETIDVNISGKKKNKLIKNFLF
jgi:ABC-type multidrug transport system fused ATPase/permease subunit